MSIPNHIAIIPDGNRRWAKEKGLPAFVGHQSGAKKFEELLQKALAMDIKFLTFWGASFDNVTKRSEEEIACLFEIFLDYFARLANEPKVHEQRVKVSVLGRWEEVFPDNLKEVVRNLTEKTKDYNAYHLTFLMAYNGGDEMIECIKSIKDKDVEVTDESIKAHLWTRDLPSVDFLIRTGCGDDPHNSAGFMMWHTAYSQLAFLNEFFPEFGAEKFEKVVMDFEQRERRRGK